MGTFRHGRHLVPPSSTADHRYRSVRHSLNVSSTSTYCTHRTLDGGRGSRGQGEGAGPSRARLTETVRVIHDTLQCRRQSLKPSMRMLRESDEDDDDDERLCRSDDKGIQDGSMLTREFGRHGTCDMGRPGRSRGRCRAAAPASGRRRPDTSRGGRRRRRRDLELEAGAQSPSPGFECPGPWSTSDPCRRGQLGLQLARNFRPERINTMNEASSSQDPARGSSISSLDAAVTGIRNFPVCSVTTSRSGNSRLYFREGLELSRGGLNGPPF